MYNKLLLEMETADLLIMANLQVNVKTILMMVLHIDMNYKAKSLLTTNSSFMINDNSCLNNDNL